LNWSPGPGVKVLGITLQNAGYWVVSAAAKPVGICPDCGTRSQHRHGWHHRRLQDLPVQGQSVKIRLALNRWQCRHRRCGRRTFTDRLPEIAAPYVRRTERMAEIVGFVGHRMGGRPGENLMHRLGMPVSDDTILRQLKRDNPVSLQSDTIRVVGVDDWSWRHSSRYGTIVVDLERHSVVDVLEDRSLPLRDKL
jgi:transposase